MRGLFKFGLLWLLVVSCKTALPPVARTYDFPLPVDTDDRPITIQKRELFHTPGLVVASNDFDGARVNRFTQMNDSTFRAVILPENEPINSSPWYAFQIWSPESRSIYLELDYTDFRHRYQPKLSRDGRQWQEHQADSRLNADSTLFTFKLEIDKDTLWVAAQEVIASGQVYRWCADLSDRGPVSVDTIGRSTLGRPLVQLDITDGRSRKKPLIIILSRQHPPEVTGFIALQAFLEAITDGSELSRLFLQRYRLLVYPLMNPDGVDLGHWRHNANGVDLNRDWAYYRQPENRQVANQVAAQVGKSKARVILGLDFHSTWYDVYYTNEMDHLTAHPEFTNQWLARIERAIPDYQVRVRPSGIGRPVSKNWFFTQFKAVGITYEIGDDTPRDFVKLKGRISAEEMMRILMER